MPCYRQDCPNGEIGWPKTPGQPPGTGHKRTSGPGGERPAPGDRVVDDYYQTLKIEKVDRHPSTGTSIGDLLIRPAADGHEGQAAPL
jgi:hypothetical protein